MEPVYWLKASAVLSIVWLIYIVFLRNDTYFQVKRFYLLMGVWLSFLLPFWHIYKVVQVHFIPNDMAYPTVNIPVFEEKQEVSMLSLSNLSWLMLFIAGVLLLKIILDLWHLFSLIQSGTKEQHKDFVLVTINKDISPFSFGKYVVINPANFTDDEYKMILHHELVHIKQKHWIDILVANILSALQWYNPVAWFYRKSIDENLEFIADAQAQAAGKTPAEYQYLLLKTGTRLTAPVLSTSFYKSNLKKRIIMLQKSQTKRIKMLKISVLLPLLALFLYSFNTVEIMQNGQDKVYHIDKTTPKREIKKIEKEINAYCKEMSISIDNIKYQNGIIVSLKMKFNEQDGTEINDVTFNGKKGIARITLVVNEQKIQLNPQEMNILNKPPYEIHAIKDIEEISSTNNLDGKTTGYIKFKNKMVFYIQNQSGIVYYDKFGNMLDEETSAQINKVLDIKNDHSSKLKKSKKVYLNGKVYYCNINSGENDIDIRDQYGNPVVNNTIREKITKQIFDKKEPVYVLNGKIVSKKDFINIKPDKIESVRVLKGKKAVSKYGDKAQAGAIEFILKK